MYIDKYKQAEGNYVDEADCFYDDAEKFLQAKILGFCCCGDAALNLEFIRNGLQHIMKGFGPNDPSLFDEWYDKWVEEGIKIFGNESSCQFFFYWCDKEGLAAHNYSIPGVLTDKGAELLEDLNEWIH